MKVEKSKRGEENYPTHAYDSPQGDHVDGAIDGSATWQDCPGCPVCAPNDGLVLRRGSWRPTKSHEYLFMLAKSDKYFCDADAVRENNADPTRTNYTPGKEAYSIGNVHDDSGRERRNDGFEAYKNGKTCVGRNRRTVWQIATAPYSGAHFATFPPALVEPCIRAATSEHGC